MKMTHSEIDFLSLMKTIRKSNLKTSKVTMTNKVTTYIAMALTTTQTDFSTMSMARSTI